MDADRRRIVLANISAALLVAGAATACGAVSFADETTQAVVVPSSLAAVLAAMVVAGFAWAERRAKFVAALAMVILVAGASLEAYEYLAPPVFAFDDSELPPGFRKLVPLHTSLTKPKPGEWLNGNVELGQSYRQYVEGDRVRLDDVRRVIYVQPLGEFNDDERKILNLTAEFLGLFYQVPVRVNEGLPLSVVADAGRRIRPGRDMRLITGYVLREVLKPRLPADAVAMLALTKSSLSPNAESGSLLGQASLVDRVGVWSIGWIDGPIAGDDEFLRMLRRTLRISTHETGHMFSIDHCIYYRCCMNGSSGLEELDRQPLWLCPQCQAKLAYATGGDPAKQLTDLIRFADAHGLKPEAAFWRRSLATMQE